MRRADAILAILLAAALAWALIEHDYAAHVARDLHASVAEADTLSRENISLRVRLMRCEEGQR